VAGDLHAFMGGVCFDPSPLPGLMSSSVDIPVVGTLGFLHNFLGIIVKDD
jgi:hypothetical protein